MAEVTLQDLLQAGVHFGHSVRYWNPKTKDYVFTTRNRVHIIDLRKTLQALQETRNAVSRISANGQKILFAGTKRPVANVIEEEAKRAGMPFVSRRWLGGMLTNYRTIKQSIARFQELERMQQDSTMDKLSKKEAMRLMREYENLQRNIGGIKDMGGLPQALFVVDVHHERIAVEEARKMKIPVFAIVDTNSNPDGVDYVIPGNDDSRRSVALLVQVVADACLEGRQQAGGEAAVVATAAAVAIPTPVEAEPKSEPEPEQSEPEATVEQTEAPAEAGEGSDDEPEQKAEDKLVVEQTEAPAEVGEGSDDEPEQKAEDKLVVEPTEAPAEVGESSEAKPAAEDTPKSNLEQDAEPTEKKESD